MRNNTSLPLSALALTALVAAPAASAQDDGAPHIAVAFNPSTNELEVEFEVEAGLDESVTPTRLTLDVSNFSTMAGGFSTIPTNNTPSPNDDLGFVSEVEGSDTEGGDIGAVIGIRLTEKDDDFRVFFNNGEILTEANPIFTLGSAFDRHPIWVLDSDDSNFLGFSDASFDVINLDDNNAVLESFQVRLAVPEPTSAAVLAGSSLLLLRRRRATA